MSSSAPRRRIFDALSRNAYRPGTSAVTIALTPLTWIYRALACGQALLQRRAAASTGLPVVVVGNLVAGGAGKTPVVIAIVHALREAGFVPGVISRGYGRTAHATAVVSSSSAPQDVGDEPLLVHRRTAAPVVVDADRLRAAGVLRAAFADVDVIVADDGLQHRRLRRDVDVIVFDERGIGNGRLLPAGPLREPMRTQPPAHALVLYNHDAPTTPWPGGCATRALGRAVPLASWLAGRHDDGVELASLQARAPFAAAGIAAPRRFFAMLAGAGLVIRALPLPDHHDYATLPWPADAGDVVVTEKDAVKLAPHAHAASPRIWVVPLDLRLPRDFVAALLARLPPPRRR